MDDDGVFFLFPLNPSTFNRLPGGCERHQIKVHIPQYNTPDTGLTCTVAVVVGDPLQKLPTDSCSFVVPHLPFTTHCPWLRLFWLHSNQIDLAAIEVQPFVTYPFTWEKRTSAEQRLKK